MYDLYDLPRVAGWEAFTLNDLGHVSWVGSYRTDQQILHNISSQRQVRILDDLDDLDRVILLSDVLN